MPPLGEQKLLPGQVGQREPLPPGQGMSRRREETAGLGLVQQADKGRVSDRLVKGIGQVRRGWP